MNDLDDAAAESRHLRVALDWEVDVLDPPSSFGGWNTGRVAHQIFESLVEDDLSVEGGKLTQVRPALAQDIEISGGGLVYTFRLRTGVLFHDGTRFDAAAVDYNLRRIWDSSFGGYNPVAATYNQIAMRHVSKVDVVDSMTVRVHLAEVFPEFLRYMTQEDSPGSLVFLSPTGLEKLRLRATDETAAGTGPFKLDRRFDTEFGSSVSLRRNDQYWGGAPWLERITFTPIPDAHARAEALLSGAAELAYGPAPDQLHRLQQLGFRICTGDVPYVWYLAFNMESAPTKSHLVRHAIAHAIDKQALSDMFGSSTRPLHTMLPPASPSYDPNCAEPYPYDPERARRLMTQAGHDDGLVLCVEAARAGSSQLDPVKIYDFVANALRKIGIELRAKFHDDWVSYCQNWQNGIGEGIAFNEMSWGMSADVWLEQILHSRFASPVGFNTGFFKCAELDKALDSARREISEECRVNLYRNASDIVCKHLPVLPLLTIHSGLAVHSEGVSGFKFAPQNWHDFRSIQFTS